MFLDITHSGRDNPPYARVGPPPARRPLRDSYSNQNSLVDSFSRNHSRAGNRWGRDHVRRRECGVAAPAARFPAAAHLALWIGELLFNFKQEFAIAADYFAMREHAQAFSQMAAFNTSGVNWTGTDRPEQLTVSHVTASFFTMLGVTPLRGRVFRADEDVPGANLTVVVRKLCPVAAPFWRRSRILRERASARSTARAHESRSHAAAIRFPHGHGIMDAIQAE